MTFPIPVSCRVSYPLSSWYSSSLWDVGSSPSSFYILLDDKACLSMFYQAFAPLSTTGMVILPAPLPREELVRQAKSELPLSRRWRLSSMLATAFGPFPRFFQFPYILAEGETLPLLREGQSGTTPFRARRLTPLCIPTKVSQTRTSLMHPAASLIWIGYTEGWVGYILLCALLLRTFWYVLPPNYRSDPPDEKLNSALLLSRRTYPPRDSWNFCGLRWGKSTKARQIDRLLSRC